MNKEVAVEIILLVAKYGIESALEIIKNWDKDEITLEDVMALRSRIKPPDAY